MEEPRQSTRHDPIRVGIVDDDRFTRDSLARLLQQDAGIEVQWVAHGGHSAIEALSVTSTSDHPTQIALVDINMPIMGGAQVCAALREIDPQLRVIMLTSLDPGNNLANCLQAGACGYVMKDDAPEALPHIVRATLSGVDMFSGSVSSMLAGSLNNPPTTNLAPKDTATSPLTEREHEVLIAVADSLTNSQIAHRLHISEPTVKAHLRAIMTKLDCVDRVGVIAWAFRNGIID